MQGHEAGEGGYRQCRLAEKSSDLGPAEPKLCGGYERIGGQEGVYDLRDDLSAHTGPGAPFGRAEVYSETTVILVEDLHGYCLRAPPPPFHPQDMGFDTFPT